MIKDDWHLRILKNSKFTTKNSNEPSAIKPSANNRLVHHRATKITKIAQSVFRKIKQCNEQEKSLENIPSLIFDTQLINWHLRTLKNSKLRTKNYQ